MLMLNSIFLALVVSSSSLVGAKAPVFIEGEPTFQVPSLAKVRDILARLEAPIISTIVSRAALPAEKELYAYNGIYLTEYIQQQEYISSISKTFRYGSLEYPFTMPITNTDGWKPKSLFPPGTFRQDSFTPNKNLTTFYLHDFLPLLRSMSGDLSGNSPFYHLSNGTHRDRHSRQHKIADASAKLALDYQLLNLLSHRASIGKVVAEAKYGASTNAYTNLIKHRDRNGIRKLLTNTTQEASVLKDAQTASKALASAWETAQDASKADSDKFVRDIQKLAAKTFRELIDITTQVEIEYLLHRLD